MRALLRYLLAFLAGVLCASLLGSVLSTQSVIAALADIDVEVTMATRVSMTVRDFGILPTLVPALAACLLPGFLIAGLCARLIGGSRAAWFVVAGATAVVAELLIMQAVLGLMPIAGARTLAGLLSFGLAGAAGGWLFVRIAGGTDLKEKRDA
ncbi:MAG: hypothetical protein QNJ07_06345 [Woeseiaceae bacterium]|nr:hypothetical protein [Woeseiaceae bacterium]